MYFTIQFYYDFIKLYYTNLAFKFVILINMANINQLKIISLSLFCFLIINLYKSIFIQFY
jgi:hypothetical protein